MKHIKRKTLIGIASLLIGVGTSAGIIAYPEWAPAIKAGTKIVTSWIQGADNVDNQTAANTVESGPHDGN